jgi:antitoxin component YwqK of YwqJK toxin-antitoxin module
MFSSEPFTRFEGPFISTATFSQGKLDGVWIISDRNTRKILEVPYRQGKRHGPATWYYPNSERRRMVNFRNGLLDGPLMEWDEQNRIVRNDEYINGQKVVRVTTFFAPQQKRSETYYLEGKLVLEGEDSWWDGEPTEYVIDGIRVQHGPTVAWHANGQRKMAGQYRDDERIGLFVWWHENGTRALAGRYEDGFKVGTWTWWHANGMKLIEGEYEDDLAIGEWIWWKKDGDIEFREDFGQGRDSTGDLPDPDEDGSATELEIRSSEGEMSAPPEGGIPDEREEIRPDPFDDDQEQGLDYQATNTGNEQHDETEATAAASGDQTGSQASDSANDGGL